MGDCNSSIFNSDLFLSIFIILIFVGLYLINILGVGIKNIQQNWSLYRCNPIVIPFAGLFGKDVTSNFSFCIQNMQQSFISELLQPIHYSMGLMGNIGKDLTSALTAVRAFFNKIRTFITHIIQEIMGVFLNILISIQKLTIDMKDIFSKIGDFLGGLTTILLSFVSLSILAEVIFGLGFFGTSVVTNVMEIVKVLGDGGFIGLVALLILWSVFDKK